MATWKPPFTPAHRKRRDPLRAAVLAPSVTVPPVVCGSCGDPRLIHRESGPCLRVGCTCEQWVEET